MIDRQAKHPIPDCVDSYFKVYNNSDHGTAGIYYKNKSSIENLLIFNELELTNCVLRFSESILLENTESTLAFSLRPGEGL